MERLILKYLIDGIILFFATFIAFVLRLEPTDSPYIQSAFSVAVILFPIKVGVFFISAIHKQSWRNISVRDLLSIIVGVIIFSLISLIIAGILRPYIFFPLSVPVIEGMILLLSLSFVRLMARVADNYIKTKKVPKENKRRVLIIGAGESGTMIAREMMRHPESGYQPVGFLDDDPKKVKKYFVGLPVFGTSSEIAEWAKLKTIDEILIAMPSEAGGVIRNMVHAAQAAKIKCRTMPALHELISEKVSISQIREVDVEDLLRRKPVELENHIIEEYLKNKTVLVTGAGGSIGSEIVRQIVKFQPKTILLVGRGENSIYLVEEELKRFYELGVTIIPIIADVRDKDSLQLVFNQYSPQVVFHAGAHKHVPLMESNPHQAILNNVGGTKNLVELALKHNVVRFVNISTDKAVNPTSIMGASKRVAEYVVEWASRQANENQSFVSVRFGNVLGSRGSVVPKFKEQIKRGGPVTVTHPDMTRFFMTIPEASQLVLQAAGIGENGAVYILDMGESVKIVDMAKELIRLSGFEPETDIKIQYSGIRPGEKLFEELLTAEEGTNSTRHEKIYVAKKSRLRGEDFEALLQELFEHAHRGNKDSIQATLHKIIPTYSFNGTS